MSIVRIELNDAWLSFIETRADTTVFHHPKWCKLIADSYGYHSFGLLFTDSSNKYVAGLPIIQVHNVGTNPCWVSLPFTDYCPPLVDCENTLVKLTSLLVDLRINNNISSLEVRAPLLASKQVHPHSSAVLHTLALKPDADSIFRRFKRTQVQQCITRAQKEGVTVRFAESLADLDVFYNLHLQTRRRLGVPVQPYRFFELLWKRMIEPGLGFILIGYKDRVPLASSVFLSWNGTVIYKYSASDPAYWSLRPNNLVLWTAIQWGCEHGYHTFDFGRTDLNNKGLRDFKNGWGTREEPLIYSTISAKPPRLSSDRLSHLMGPIIRHSPPIVCRAVGELFYKYAA